MLKLTEDIKIFDYNQYNSHKPRILINNGTRLASQDITLNNYSQDSFIPIELWRETNLQEQQLIYGSINNHNKDKSKQIGIIKIPHIIMDSFDNLGFGLITTYQECSYLTKNPYYQKTTSQLMQYLLTLAESYYPITKPNISINYPKLPTVTYNRDKDCYIGLHLDSWDKMPLEKRQLSTNRICLNLGLEDRYFLFINLTLINMFLLVKKPGREKIQAESIRELFLSNYPDYPVIKIRVSPGEAYIAPTENMIHDGCTMNKQFFDVIMTVRGNFNLPSQSKSGDRHLA